MLNLAVLSLYEGGLPMLLDARTLQTKYECSFDGALWGYHFLVCSLTYCIPLSGVFPDVLYTTFWCVSRHTVCGGKSNPSD